MRCVHLDWFEVCAVETQPLTPQFFEDSGYRVDVRPYGTPMYAQMFTILEGKEPVYEIRRCPLAKKSDGGIFDDNMCHIRFVNKTCYLDRCIDAFRYFLIKCKVEYRGISRIDICNDFTVFDNGTDPQNMIADYMQEKISKINQSRVSAHGQDLWQARVWNSLKWGSLTSCVTTKIYNKTMELEVDGHDKPWIRDAWEHSRIASTQWCSYLGDDGQEHYRPHTVKYGTAVHGYVPEDTVDDVQVWRVEFSIKSQGKHFINTDNGTRLSIELDTIDTADKLLRWFHILAFQYFHFKELVRLKDGTVQRKDRCPDVKLFTIADDAINFHPFKTTTEKRPTRSAMLVCKKLAEVSRDVSYTDDERRLCVRVAAEMLLRASNGNVDLRPKPPKQWRESTLTMENAVQ